MHNLDAYFRKIENRFGSMSSKESNEGIRFIIKLYCSWHANGIQHKIREAGIVGHIEIKTVIIQCRVIYIVRLDIHG